MSHIYFVTTPSAREKGIFKIGMSKDIGARISAMQTSHYEEITTEIVCKVRNPRVTERMLHRMYRNSQIINEWFRISPEHIKEIKDLLMSQHALVCKCLGCSGVYSRPIKKITIKDDKDVYTFAELRENLKTALDMAKKSHVKILRRREIFYLLSEEEYSSLVVDTVKRSLNQRSQNNDDPVYTEIEPYA